MDIFSVYVFQDLKFVVNCKNQYLMFFNLIISLQFTFIQKNSHEYTKSQNCL